MKDKNSTHYFEISDLITQFCSAFDSIIINRYENKSALGNTKVRFVYSPKQKVLHNLVNKAEHITVPVIAVNITSIGRDRSRVHTKNTGHYIKNEGSVTDHIPQPVPVNIGVNMSVITRYQQDMDQILSNFIPYTNPYIIISWKLPEEFSAIETELRTEVLWDENITLDQPNEMGESDKYRNVANTTFVIKGWLFKRHPDTKESNIYEIDSRFIPVSSISDLGFEDELVDTLSLSAYPVIDDSTVNKFVTDTSPTYKVEGQNLLYTTSVYLSSDTGNMFSDPLSSFEYFDGIPLTEDEYTLISSGIMYVDMKLFEDVGNVSIIVENPSGYAISESIAVV